MAHHSPPIFLRIEFWPKTEKDTLIMTDADISRLTQVQKTRLYSRALTLCPGWVDWALPKFRGEIERLDKLILDTPTLRGSDLDDARAERKAIIRLCSLLSTDAQGAWTTSLPGVVSEELATEIMPEMNDRQAILDNLSPYAAKPLLLITPPTPLAPPPVFDQPRFNPFASS